MWHKCSRYYQIGVSCPFQVIHPKEVRRRRRPRRPEDPEEHDEEERPGIPPVLPPVHKPGPRDPLKVPAEREPGNEIIKDPPLVPLPPLPAPPLPIPVLPGPDEEEPDEEPVPQVPVPVGVPQGGTPFRAPLYLLPDNLSNALKGYIADRNRRDDVPDDVRQPALPPPRAQEAPTPRLALQQGIYQGQRSTERAYAHTLAEAAERQFVRGIEEQLERNERVARDTGFYEELGWLAPAVVAGAGIAYGLHALQKLINQPPPIFQAARPAPRGGGGGFLFMDVKTQEALMDPSLRRGCQYCGGEIVE